MRALFVLGLLAPASAAADVSVGAAVGAGAQGATTYSALELRLDAAWQRVRLGLGVRGVWEDAVFRRAEWQRAADAVAIIRDLEVSHELGETTLALAAGALAPARLGHLADGYRVTLDDRWRTGVRAAARAQVLDVGLEVDDVLDPVLFGGGLRYQMAPPWGMQLGLAVDPDAPALRGAQTITAIEAGAHRRYEGDRARAELGVSVVAEISLGASAVAFGTGAIERGGITWSARGELRAGTGTVGAVFGPLYRIERLAHAGRQSMWDRARESDLAGAAASLSLGASAPAGWLELGARARPGLADLITVSGGAPMGRWVQGALWVAAGRDDAAGAAELRVAWANTLFSALQAARIYRLDAMEPSAVWSVTAWFGAATR